MKILFIIFAIISFIGMVGENDKTFKKYLTISFVICVLALILLSLFG